MTTHLLIKAIALQVRAMSMCNTNQMEAACGGAATYQEIEFDLIEKQIEDLASQALKEQTEQSVSTTINLTERLQNAARTAAEGAYENLRSQYAPPNNVPPKAEDLETGMAFAGVRQTDDAKYHATITELEKRYGVMGTNHMVMSRISVRDGILLTNPEPHYITYEQFVEEFQHML